MEEIVQKNLNAYNARDIEGFVACLSNDIAIFQIGEPTPSVSGVVEVKSFYAELFENSPELHSNILKRIVIGNTVIDHESITGRNGSDAVVELVLIYEVKNAKISRITVVRD